MCFKKIKLLLSAIAILLLTIVETEAEQNYFTSNSVIIPEIPQYTTRLGRSKPIIAVVGENSFTELTDYVVPYGVLKTSGVAEVFALATKVGPIQMFPALKLHPQTTVDAFDSSFPEGADYIIVPAVHRAEDSKLISWVLSQAKKGAVIVGICDGVWVVANAGLLDGRKAVGHWYSFGDLERKFPNTAWIKNKRYIADGNIVTTTGVTASIPVSLAIIEAIAGSGKAASVADQIGVNDWRAEHTSNNFKLNTHHIFTAAINSISFWTHEVIEIPISNGINEISLALIADAYSRTYRSNAVSISSSPEGVLSRNGLIVIPDKVINIPNSSKISPKLIDEIKPINTLEASLSEIANKYGQATSNFVALQMEYPRQ